MTRRARRWLLAGALAIGSFAGCARYHQVDLTLTAEDREFAARILGEAGVATPSGAMDFEAEIRFVEAVQRAVLAASPSTTPIPERQPREPADLYRGRHGMCFDRSRTIEKILRIHGFRVRHVSAYRSRGERIPALAIFRTGIRSHAFTEVLTQRGWMVVDSNDPFLALDATGHPVDAPHINKNVQNPVIQWAPRYEPHFVESVYKFPFITVYGWYSRHGRFYPPYNGFPDVNWGELTENL